MVRDYGGGRTILDDDTSVDGWWNDQDDDLSDDDLGDDDIGEDAVAAEAPRFEIVYPSGAAGPAYVYVADDVPDPDEALRDGIQAFMGSQEFIQRRKATGPLHPQEGMAGMYDDFPELNVQDVPIVPVMDRYIAMNDIALDNGASFVENVELQSSMSWQDWSTLVAFAGPVIMSLMFTGNFDMPDQDVVRPFPSYGGVPYGSRS